MKLYSQANQTEPSGRPQRQWAMRLLPLAGWLVLSVAVAAAQTTRPPERGFVSSQPAKGWEQALISGNGRMGALVYGQTLR